MRKSEQLLITFGRHSSSGYSCGTCRVLCLYAESVQAKHAILEMFTGIHAITTIAIQPMSYWQSTAAPGGSICIAAASARTCAARSSTSPPRSSSPRRAPALLATSTAVGVANPSAHGQATTSTSTASRAPRNAAPPPPPVAAAAAAASGNRLPPASRFNAFAVAYTFQHSRKHSLAKLAIAPAVVQRTLRCRCLFEKHLARRFTHAVLTMTSLPSRYWHATLILGMLC